MTVLQFCLLGMGAGALYGLAALGLVLIYRGSGVINFAHGAVGMVGTYLFWYLHDQHGQSFVVAAVPALALCAAIGYAIQLLVMHPLRASSPVSRLLATLGVLAALQGAVAIKYPDEALVVRSSLPTSSLHIGSLYVGEDRVLILAIGLALSIILGVVYKYTKFGIATSAVADNPRVAGHLGYSANSIASANWALGSILAGLAGILLAPITGLQTTALTLLVVPALAAALVGSMASFPLTMAAGLVIGIAQSLLTRFVSDSSWSSAVPFLLVLVVLLVRGSAFPARGEQALRLPSVGTGQIRWTYLVASFVLGIVLVRFVPVPWVVGITVTVLSGIVLLSVVIVTGYAGQVSLAQIAMAGSTTLIASHLITNAGVPFLLALIIGMIAAIPIGILVGLPALRARGAHLAIVTLSMSVAVEAMVLNRQSITGGVDGVQVGFPHVFGLDIDSIGHPRRYAMFTLVAFTLVALAVANLRRSRTGRRLLAVRANERAAASLGVSVVGAKLYAFAVSSMLAALGGMLIAFQQPIVVFSDYHSFDSVTYVADSVIGGVGHVVGAALGGILQVGGLGTNIGNIFGSKVQEWLPVIGGVVLIIVLIQDPDGVAASMAARFRRFSGKLSRTPTPLTPGVIRARLAPATAPTEPHKRDMPVSQTRVLGASNISVRFGGVYALRDVTLDVHAGEVVGLIGPNGSGKTTLIDVLTGFQPPAAGTVHYAGSEINGWSPRRRSEGGIACSFQSLELFEDMTVLENLLVASERSTTWSSVSDLLVPRRSRLTPTAVAAADRLSLWSDMHSRPAELPYGRRRLLSLARALAREPKVLLLDESASGLNPEERDELSSLVRTLAHEEGIGVLFIEHDVDLVMRTCDRVVALEFGQVIAEGSPDSVRRHPDVIRAYLGVDDDYADHELEAVEGS